GGKQACPTYDSNHPSVTATSFCCLWACIRLSACPPESPRARPASSLLRRCSVLRLQRQLKLSPDLRLWSFHSVLRMLLCIGGMCARAEVCGACGVQAAYCVRPRSCV